MQSYGEKFGQIADARGLHGGWCDTCGMSNTTCCHVGLQPLTQPPIALYLQHMDSGLIGLEPEPAELPAEPEEGADAAEGARDEVA